MNNATGWLITALLLLVLFIRRPCWLLAVPVSALVYWDFGAIGLAVLWAALLAVRVHAEALGR